MDIFAKKYRPLKTRLDILLFLKLNFSYINLKYFHPELGFAITDTGWFGPRQVVRNIPFTLLDASYNEIAQDNFVPYVTGITGYILTNKQFAGTTVTNPDIFDVTSARITGYIIPKSITPGKLFGTTWKDAGNIPSVNLSFIPGRETVNVLGATNAQRITGLFTGITDRGYPNGTGLPFPANEPLCVFFTGTNQAQPIYLTYVSGTPLRGQSYLSGRVTLTDFTPPSAYPLHAESSGVSGWRLATNYSHANYYGPNIYTATAGGEYPALSFDNGLEMYLDISYSSPCGPNVLAGSCIEPI